jgi:prepilin-type N-terminal cleavage/methylation domain-containing protein
MDCTTSRIQRRDERAQSSGFTLIELLIVIVVLGILAAVVVFALGSVTSKSAKSSCAADAKTVETAVAAFEANGNGTSPTSTALTASTTTGGPYLRSWPSNPSHYYIGIAKTATPTSPDEVDVAAGSVLPTTSAGWVAYETEGTLGCNAVT